MDIEVTMQDRLMLDMELIGIDEMPYYSALSFRVNIKHLFISITDSLTVSTINFDTFLNQLIKDGGGTLCMTSENKNVTSQLYLKIDTPLNMIHLTYIKKSNNSKMRAAYIRIHFYILPMKNQTLTINLKNFPDGGEWITNLLYIKAHWMSGATSSFITQPTAASLDK